MQENKSEETQIKSEFKPNRRQRIRAWKLMRQTGFLPTKPEAKVVGKHEFIRLEGVDDKYPEKGAEFSESTLSIKLNELKSTGRKVLGHWRDWGGWTIKLMADKTT